jgi:hypothetical protein
MHDRQNRIAPSNLLVQIASGKDAPPWIACFSGARCRLSSGGLAGGTVDAAIEEFE